MLDKLIEKFARYYLTHYVDYPIYEPAEGGYYYAGRSAEEGYCFLTKWGAKRYLAKMRAKLEECGWIVNADNAHLSSKYIGDSEHWYVERYFGSHESGRQVYQ